MAKEYLDLAGLQRYTAGLKSKLGAMISSPLVANAAAEMTDTSRIYVYTGSETGYNTGHWYYYDGDSWEDGGVYQAAAVQTDTTLTIAGEAADAKATGDAVKAVLDVVAALATYVKVSPDPADPLIISDGADASAISAVLQEDDNLALTYRADTALYIARVIG